MAEWPRVEAMPGALAALEALSVLPVQCVATNATDSDGIKVAEALERVGLRSRLTHFFTSLELGHSKPDPEFFVDVSRKLRIPPEALMAIGNDLQKDIVPAKAVGMRTVLVLPESTPLSHEKADLIVTSLTRLAECLRNTPGENL
jgi:putative hydrolase of the HAD superfamily